MFVLGMYEQLTHQRKEKQKKADGEEEELESMDVLLAKVADYLNGDLPTPDIVIQTVKDLEVQAGKSSSNDRLMRDAGI